MDDKADVTGNPVVAETDVSHSPKWFTVISVLYIAAAVVAMLRNWDDMLRMRPNEWADVAAGIFSPLALLWFLYTALAQRAELRLQHRELADNVAAQRDQEAQMRRHANALDAQLRRVEAQANAEYQPLLSLQTTAGLGEAGTRLTIKNWGATVLDLKIEPGAWRHIRNPDEHIVYTAGGEVLPIWISEHSIEVDFEAGREDGAGNLTFQLRFTRRDLIEVEQRYLCIMRERRLVLLSSGPPTPRVPRE